MARYSQGLVYKAGKIQDEVEDFINSDDNEREIVIPYGRTLESVRGSYIQAIKSTHRLAKIRQKDGKLFIKRKF